MKLETTGPVINGITAYDGDMLTISVTSIPDVTPDDTSEAIIVTVNGYELSVWSDGAVSMRTPDGVDREYQLKDGELVDRTTELSNPPILG